MAQSVRRPPQMSPQQAAAIYNPMNPREDTDEVFVWRTIAAVGQSQEQLQAVMDSMHKDKFDYASTVPSQAPHGSCALHIYRRRRSTMVDQNNHLEKLRLQIAAFKLKIESDELQIVMAKLAKERTDALKILAEHDFQVADQK